MFEFIVTVIFLAKHKETRCSEKTMTGDAGG